jgi:hypothetical protein
MIKETTTTTTTKPMTRAEKIKIRAERVRQRRIRLGLPPLDSNVASNTTIIETTTTITPMIQIPKELPLIIPEGKLTIEICIHCFRYQKRLTWMLSSILQQKGDIPNIIVNISHTDDDGNPTTEQVCNFFREKGLNIVETKVTKEEVSNRALARNKQATATTADWILFADSDMVYSEYFFDDLQKRLKTILKDIKIVMGADRHSLDDQFCIKYFEEDKRIYPCVIENVGEITSEFPVKWKCGSGIAPGNFQLINGDTLRGKCKGKITDRAGDHWRRTKGDRALRVRVGGRIGIETKAQYHLNHDRGGPEIQR